jgi:uncharacterized protein YndB with AHSA1/START domain
MSSDAAGSNRIIGSLRAADGTGAVRMEDRFDTGIDDLWSALTEPRRLARWLGDFTGDLRLGGQFQAHFFASGWEGTGRVEMCEPPRHLLVLTREAKREEHAIEATLTADGEQTLLVIEERGMPPELLAAYGAGVQIHVEDLAAHVAGRDRSDAGPRWLELLPPYEDLAAQVN